MLSPNKISQKVHWFEGMLLSPQHFQQAELYVEGLIAHQSQRLSRFHWGVFSCQVDEVALATGVFRVTNLHGAMPDGLIVHHQPHGHTQLGDADLSIDLNALDIDTQSDFDLSVAVARDGEGDSSESGGELQRYISVNQGLTADRNEAERKVDVVRLMPKLRLVLDRDLSPNYVSLRVARLRRQGDGSFMMTPYTPPVFSLDRNQDIESSKLFANLHELLGNARRKGNRLRAMHSARKVDQLRQELQKEKVIKLMSKLNSLELLLDSGAHPFEIYSAFVDYASDLAQLNDDPIAPQFSKYDHDQLDQTFEVLISFIHKSIADVRVDFTAIPFSQKEADTYTLTVDKETVEGELMLSFKVPSTATKETMDAWVQSAYICCVNDFNELRLSRSVGLDRKKVTGFSSINLKESASEVLYVIDLPPTDSVVEILISESDSGLANSRPELITLFVSEA